MGLAQYGHKIMTQYHNHVKGKLWLKEGYLYVANTGRAFDEEGVRAISLPYITGKRNRQDRLLGKGKAWLDKFIVQQKTTWQNDHYRIESDYESEEGHRKDYKGRWILELLQNIDDAGHEKGTIKKFIGTKGLGFLAVLNIGDEPEIFSGDFQFGFSREKNKRLIHEMWPENKFGDKIPTFIVPHKASPCETVKKLRKEYDTVIKIKLSDIEKVKEGLAEFDNKFLLLSRTLTEMVIDDEGDMKTYSREIQNVAQDGDIKIDKIMLHSSGIETMGWMRWMQEWDEDETEEQKSLSVGFCLPIDENKKKCKDSSEEKLWNFYSTKQSIGLKALLHVTFELTQNREDFNPRENESLANDQKLIETCCNLAAKIVQSKWVSPQVALTVFADLTWNGNSDKPHERLGWWLFKTMQATKFVPKIGGGVCCPGEARIWTHELGEVVWHNDVKTKNLVRANLNETCEAELEQLGAKTITPSEVFSILETSCQNDTSENCVRILDTAQGYFAESSDKYKIYNRYRHPEKKEGYVESVAVLSIPCFMDEEKTTHRLDKNKYYLLNKKNLQGIPKFLERPQLHDGIAKWLEGQNSLRTQIENKLVISEVDVLNKLIPHEIQNWKDNDWKEKGVELLNYLMKLKDHKNIEGMRLPIKGNKWELASKICLSEEWNLSKKLEQILVDIEEKIPLQKPSEIKKLLAPKIKIKDKKQPDFNKEKIRKLALTLGVSDSPSIQVVEKWQMLADEYQEFILAAPYLTNFRAKQTLKHRSITDYHVKGLPIFLRGMEFNEQMRIASQIKEKSREKSGEYFYKKERSPERYNNYIGWLLARQTWLTPSNEILKEGWLVADHDGYIAPFELAVLEEEKIFRTNAENVKNIKKIKLFYSHKDIDQKASIWKIWLERAEKNWTKRNKENDNDERQLRNLYSEWLEWWRQDAQKHVPRKLPAKIFGSTEIEFLPKENVFINDLGVEDSIFAEEAFKNALADQESDQDINKGIFIFGQNVSLGLDSLKDKLKLEPEYNIDKSEKKLDRIKQRWDYLKVIADKRDGNRKKEFETFKKNITLCSELSVAVLGADGERLSIFPQLFFISKEQNIFIQNDYRSLANYLNDKFFESRQATTLIRNVLNAEGQEEIEEYLLDEKITKDDIKDVKYNDEEEQNILKTYADETDSDGQQDYTQTRTETKTDAPHDGNGGIISPPSPTPHPRVQEDANLNNKNKERRIPPQISKPWTRAGAHSGVSEADREVGDHAEKIVIQFLKTQGIHAKNMNEPQANHPGCDLTFEEGGETIFAEVKGTKNEWNEQPRFGPTTKQMATALEKGEKYRLYIVEYVDKNKNPEDHDHKNIHQINDPWNKVSFFSFPRHDWEEK